MTDDLWDRIFRERAGGRRPAEEVVRAVAGSGARVFGSSRSAAAPGHSSGTSTTKAIGPSGSMSLRLRSTRRGCGSPTKAPRCRSSEGTRLAPFASASFDLVLDVETFADVPPGGPPAAWTEAGRVLVPNGRLVSIGFTATTTGTDSGTVVDDHTVRDLRRGPLADRGAVTFISRPRVDALAAAAGVTIEDVQQRSRTVGPEHDRIDELVVVARR